MAEGDNAEVIAEWLGGEIETEAEPEVDDSRLDAESREMIRTQRHYYDSVHRIKEKVRRHYVERYKAEIVCNVCCCR